MKRTCLVLLLLGLVVSPALWAGDAAASAPATASAFDGLGDEPDVIYLIANSSLVFGPDPNGRSEEITFAGLVTSPKWPMSGYKRRTLADGREQIDIELTQSELVGESYLLGTVRLGEHPDLRSLGTITQRKKGDNTPAVAAKGSRAAERVADVRPVANPSAPAAKTEPAATVNAVHRFRLTRAMARTIELNPEIDWDDLIGKGMRRLLEKTQVLKAKNIEPTVVPPVTATRAEAALRMPGDVANAMNQHPEINWDGWVYQAVQTEIDQLADANLIVRPQERFEAAVLPNDFVVDRKVLITTAKGILYNEAPVPVRGTIDSIPPVKRMDTPEGVNVFLGMELPVPLLDEKGNVDGWFYSKAHMAYAVLPDAIQRETLKGTIRLRSGNREETVAVRGPIEIHHGPTHTDAKGNQRTEIEVIVLALRGRSEILGGDVMLVESFSDRDRFSRGKLTWKNGKATESALALFTEVYTPSGKLAVQEPIQLTVRMGDLASLQQPLERGRVRIPLLKSSTAGHLSARAGRPLYDEAERVATDIVGVELDLAIEEKMASASSK